MPIAKPARVLARDQSTGSHVGQHLQTRIVQRNLSPLPFPSLGPACQGAQDGDGGQHPRAHVDDRHTHLHGLAVGFPGDGHQPRFSLENEVVAGPAGLWTTGAVAADAASDHLGSVAFEPRVREAPTVQCPKLEVVDNNIGRANQISKEVTSRFGLEVDGDAALVPIDTEEVGGLGPGERGTPGAGVVAATRPLDLDDVCAHVPEPHGAQRTGQNAG